MLARTAATAAKPSPRKNKSKEEVETYPGVFVNLVLESWLPSDGYDITVEEIPSGCSRWQDA